jgi:hypothetical protein
MGKYLHKDFHGALSYCMGHIAENYGNDVLEKYLREITLACYKGLIEKIKENGIEAWKEHLDRICTLEEADYTVEDLPRGFTLRVTSCPAIDYMRRKNFPLYQDFCRSTTAVNDTIAAETGLFTRTDHDFGKGACVQYFSEVPL